ncbi:MAG: four helix bundle protein, partial [bacterium]
MTKYQFTITNFQTIMDLSNTNLQTRTYDLEERTARFAEQVIDLMKQLPKNSINNRMIDQLVGSGGSIGANYCEANEAESRTDFIHKIGICKKEIKETRHWIRLLTYANPTFKDEFKVLS